MAFRIVNKSNNPIPQYETAGSAGMDIRAHLNETVSLKPGERALIPTGLYMEMEVGYEAQIRARSGLAIKHGIGLVNAPGTIDSDYRGEIGIILINWSDKTFEIKSGDRIAQMVIARYEQIQWKEVSSLEELADSERGSGGFGHTGR
jgi:dUTP pyrophosphatase